MLWRYIKNSIITKKIHPVGIYFELWILNFLKIHLLATNEQKKLKK